jgi:sn-glycerol 3-phosphate transport system substrate-binding protein
MEQHCKRFNESQTKYEAVCIGQGGYDKAEQHKIISRTDLGTTPVIDLNNFSTEENEGGNSCINC